MIIVQALTFSVKIFVINIFSHFHEAKKIHSFEDKLILFWNKFVPLCLSF